VDDDLRPGQPQRPQQPGGSPRTPQLRARVGSLGNAAGGQVEGSISFRPENFAQLVEGWAREWVAKARCWASRRMAPNVLQRGRKDRTNLGPVVIGRARSFPRERARGSRRARPARTPSSHSVEFRSTPAPPKPGSRSSLVSPVGPNGTKTSRRFCSRPAMTIGPPFGRGARASRFAGRSRKRRCAARHSVRVTRKVLDHSSGWIPGPAAGLVGGATTRVFPSQARLSSQVVSARPPRRAGRPGGWRWQRGRWLAWDHSLRRVGPGFFYFAGL